ncbi:MAG: sensor histidine kinase [Bacillota bacterium]
MTRESVVSIRWKMMIMMAASAAFAVGTTGMLLVVAGFMYRLPVIGDILTYLGRSGYALLIVFITGLSLFIGCFVILSAGTLRYMSRISQAVNQISTGDLDVYIPVSGSDELARLAKNINNMAMTLKTSIEEEREAERTKNDLITSISHDLRTPLTSVLGYLELVDTDKYADEVTLRHYVAIALEKARSLKRLIDDLFEFTRVNYRGMTLQPETVNMAMLLEQLAEEFVPILEKAGMEYRLNLPPEKITVQGDPSLLVRVFENLMSNAVRHGADGRYVDIELSAGDGTGGAGVASAAAPGVATASSDSAGAAPSDCVRVRIANYGAPIPESQLRRIFERFVRVEESRSRDTGGAGLGLAIAKSIVDLHGGSIRAYNEDNRTVFEVALRTEA